MKENLNIGIITGKKLTDALLCEALTKKFPNIKIVQYKIPFNMWIPWIWKRIIKMGCIVLCGHIFLSIYLRIQRKIELFHKKPLWLKYTNVTPAWKELNKKKEICLSEKALIKKIRGLDVIILADSFRLSHKFFRKTKVPCLQLVWGLAPSYMGDSAGFWAFASHNKQHVGISIIERFAQFNKIRIIKQRIIETGHQEDLRSIKIKQVIKMAEILPEIIERYFNKETVPRQQTTEIICRIFQAPTLSTYLHFLKFRKINTLPHYSYNDIPCTLITAK